MICKLVASDEYAAKWRSMTVAYLDKMDDEPSRQQVYARLTDALADMLYGKMEGRSRAASLDDVHAILAGDAVAKRLRKVNKEAVALARLFAKQRAGFTVEAPDLVGLGFRKRGPGGNGEGDADALLTSDNSVGVAEAEEDRSGDVMLLGSPMLCKWGDGDGKDLHQRTVLMKAYVHLFEDDWGAE
jgi:hypothetical protein